MRGERWVGVRVLAPEQSRPCEQDCDCGEEHRRALEALGYDFRGASLMTTLWSARSLVTSGRSTSTSTAYPSAEFEDWILFRESSSA